MQTTPSQGKRSDDVSSVLEGIKNGTVNPKDEVLKRIEGSSPQMKAKLKAAVPLIEALAKKYGISNSEIESFSKAIQGKL